jgi:hypothetical protein
MAINFLKIKIFNHPSIFWLHNENQIYESKDFLLFILALLTIKAL